MPCCYIAGARDNELQARALLPMPQRSLLRLLAGFLAVPALAPEALAQIPNNSAIVSRFRDDGAFSPDGGLTVIDLSNPANAADITGLGDDLVGPSFFSSYDVGVNCVLFDERTGKLIVGEACEPGDDLDIHVLTLFGLNVISDERYTVCVPSGWGRVDQMAWLNGDIVFAMTSDFGVSGVMAGHRLGMFRPRLGPPGTPGVITPIPLAAPSARVANALAVDERRGLAYFAILDWVNPTSEIFRCPVPGDGVTPAPVTSIASVGAYVLNLGLDTAGQLLVSNWQSPTLSIDVTQPNAPVTQLPIAINDANGLAIENASGDALLAEVDTGTLFRRDGNGTLTPLATLTGAVSGVAVHQRVGTYGAATPGLGTYAWEFGSSRTNTPFLGNSDFALAISAEPAAPAASLVALSFGRASLPAFGLELLVDPLSAVVSAVPAGTSSSFALPLPLQPSLAGSLLTAQSIHLEWNFGFASSGGLSVVLDTMPAPTITAISPPSPQTGAAVTVSGTNFYGNVTLDIGGVPTPITNQSPDALTFVMPAGVACGATITATNGSGAGASLAFNPSPVISTSSAQGPAAGGSTFFVTGQNLTGAAVTINGAPITVISQTASAIVGLTPPGQPGLATVLITSPSGCAATASYTYQ